MKKIARLIRKWWWVIVGACGAIFGVAWTVLIHRGQRKSGIDPVPPTFSQSAKDQVARIELEGEVEKARARATAEAQHAEINQIEETAKTEPVVARRQMADWLTRNL